MANEKRARKANSEKAEKPSKNETRGRPAEPAHPEDAAPARGQSPVLDKVIFVRTSEELLNAVDNYVDEYKAKNPGTAFSRSDAVRSILFAKLVPPK